MYYYTGKSTVMITIINTNIDSSYCLSPFSVKSVVTTELLIHTSFPALVALWLPRSAVLSTGVVKELCCYAGKSTAMVMTINTNIDPRSYCPPFSVKSVVTRSQAVGQQDGFMISLAEDNPFTSFHRLAHGDCCLCSYRGR